MQQDMRTLVQKLGKPRSWWVFTAACIIGLLLGGLCVGLYFAGVQAAHRVGFWIIVICWSLAAWSCGSYYVGLFSGRYRNLHGKNWSELPW
jgi:hypothetical protein